VCYFAVSIKNRLSWDDALDVWGVHGVGGITGVILLGVFATTSVNAGGADGLLLGGTSFFIKEVIAVVFAGSYAFIFTYAALAAINLITPVRMSEKEETCGLDIALHGESAYL
jgi:Amt family ammonium transporter